MPLFRSETSALLMSFLLWIQVSILLMNIVTMAQQCL